MRARYDAIAEFYAAGWPDSYDDDLSIALFELVGPVEGRSVLDVGCGHGRISRELARRGSQVVGIDVSVELLTKARAIEAANPLGVDYRHGDAAAVHETAEPAYDAIVCSMSLSDIDDLDGAITSATRALKPGGTFVFSLLHPCFPGGEDVSASWPTDKSYHDEGWWSADAQSSTLRQQVGANHRTLSTYLNTLAEHGLVLDQIREPRPPADWAASRPLAATRPVFLVARLVKSC